MASEMVSGQLAVNGGTPVRNVQENPWPSWPQNSERDWETEIEPAVREVYLE